MADFFGDCVARCAVGACIRRTWTQALSQSPSDLACDRVTTRMIGARTLGEEHPNGDRGRRDPRMPKRPCRAEGFGDTLLGEQAGDVQVILPTSLVHSATKRCIHVQPPCLAVSGTTPQSE